MIKGHTSCDSFFFFFFLVLLSFDLKMSTFINLFLCHRWKCCTWFNFHIQILIRIYQGRHRWETSASGGDGYRVHERRPRHGGCLVRQSQRDRWLRQVRFIYPLRVKFKFTYFPTENCFFFRLQVIADRLVEHFVSAGQMLREWDRVKLHGTVMNTLFRKDAAGNNTDTAFQFLRLVVPSSF